MTGKSSPRLTQKRFAELLREAMVGARVSNAVLGDLTGTDATTISRYRSPDYGSGPPAPVKRRMLEKALGAPEGYLDGLVEVDWQRRRAQTVREDLRDYRTRTRELEQLQQDPDYQEEQGPGWLWSDPREAEEQVRAVLRYPERTSRASIGSPDLFTDEDRRLIQLQIVRAFIRQHERGGRAIPQWLHQIHNEVISGTFR